MCGRLNGLVCAFCIMLCGLYSVQISAATAGSAVFQAYSVLGKKRVGSNIRVDYAVKTNFEGSHIPRYKRVSAEYTPSDLAAMFASLRGKNPSSAVVTVGIGAIVGGAGWAIDELTDQITRKGEQMPDGYQPGYGWCSTAGGGCFGTPQEACDAGSAIKGGNCASTFANDYAPTLKQCIKTGTANFSCFNVIRNPGDFPEPDPVTVDIPVTDDELFDEIKKWVERAPLSTLDDLFRQPSGNPSPTDKLRNAIRDWLRDLADTDPNLTFNPPDTIVVTNPDGSTTTVENTDPAEDTVATPSQQPGTQSSQWPGFCEWAPVVCDWIDWTQEMPEDMQPEDFPVETLTVDDLRKDYNSGLGSGSCPSPVTTQFMGSQIVLSYETACYGARTYFKPILLMIAGIIAAFIIVGASRRT